jgi:flagellar protein FlaG
MMVENINPVRTVKTQIREPDRAKVVVSDALPQHSKPEQKAEPEIKISQALLNEVQQEIQMMRNVGLHFSVHQATGRTVIRVVDKETEDLIREIPPEEFLNLAVRLDEMIGILFDKKI